MIYQQRAQRWLALGLALTSMSIAATNEFVCLPSLDLLELGDYRGEQQIKLDNQILREYIDFYESNVERCMQSEQE